jgi:hypothetical protein
VDVALVRRPVDPHDVADELVALALEAGAGRRVVAARQRGRRVAARGGERLGSGQMRRGGRGGEAGGGDRDAVEEVATSDPVALVAELGHVAPSPGVIAVRATFSGGRRRVKTG